MDKQNILIVEDESLIAQSLRRDLTKLGYSISGIAKTGQRALEIAETSPPQLALMDITLQGDKDGIETAIELERDYHIPIIYITGNTDPHTLDKALATKSIGILQKPFELSVLKRLIDSAITDINNGDIASTSFKNGKDKRTSKRYTPNPVMAERFYICDERGYAMPAYLTDVSENGVAILYEYVLETGKEYKIELKFPNGSIVRGTGIVRHSINCGEFCSYGIELFLGADEQLELKKHIEFRIRNNLFEM